MVPSLVVNLFTDDNTMRLEPESCEWCIARFVE
jgi:hypothetical protein